MNTEIEKSDLETVDYWFVTCAGCGLCTEERRDWPDAINDAVKNGFELIDGAIYCEPCAEQEKHSDCEDHPCEDCLGTMIDRAMDFADMER